MRWPRLALLIALLLAAPFLALGGCGFIPLYANRGKPDNSAQNDMEATRIATIADRYGQMLRNQLVDSFNTRGEPKAPVYELKVKLRDNSEPLLIRKDEIATAVNLTLTADYELIEIGSGKVLISGSSRIITRYDIVRSPYGAIAAEQDARTRGTRQIAEDLRTRVGIYFNAARGH